VRKSRDTRPRAAVRSGDSRFEKAARQRSRRTRAHLERSQKRNRARAARPGLRARVVVAVCFCLSLGIGLLVGVPAIERAIALQGGAPPRVEWIDVLGNQRLTARQVAEATGLEKGTLLHAVAPAELEARLVTHEWIRSARVVGLPNGAIVVRIEERQPVALLRVPIDWTGQTSADATAGTTHLVDAEGVAFTSDLREWAAGSPDEVPSLLVLQASGADAAAPDASTLQVAIALGQRIAGSEMAARLGNLTIELPRPGDPVGWRIATTHAGSETPLEVVLGEGPFGAQLDRLSQLLTLAPQEARAASSIDLRFADQAVLRTRLASR